MTEEEELKGLNELVTDTYELALRARNDARADLEDAEELHRYTKIVWENASRLVSGLNTVRNEIKKQEKQHERRIR